MESILWIQIGVILLTLLSLAFISMMEAALVSVNPVRMRQLADDGHPTAALVERLTLRRQELLGGQIIMINVFVLLVANLTTAATLAHAGSRAVPFVNLLVLLLLLAFGEIVPKTFSVYFAEGISLRTARIAYALTVVLTPIVALFNSISFAILYVLTSLRILPGRVHPVPTAFSEEDIKDLVSAGEQSGEVEASERAMIHGVIEFSDTATHEIMVPRTDLVALPIDATLEEAIDSFMASGHSRIPVYEDHVDNILGLLYIKDLLIRLSEQRKGAVKSLLLREIMRPAFFVPETKKTDDLLREMQRRRVHLAIVVDEYGGTAGIVTIEDLLEEIVGDIIDEYDKEQAEVLMLPDGTAIVSGRASLEKMHETFDLQIPEATEAETISGLITETLGRIPEAGDVVVISSLELNVLDVKHNRVERLRVTTVPE